MNLKAEALKLHKRHKGKIEIISKIDIKGQKELSLVYTPGVAEVSREVYRCPSSIYDYTSKGNIVGVVTDGSAVLGLGNIGAEAALPVMEGKCALFKQLANIDAFPICIKSQEPGDIINIVKNIAPGFGGINLEDIASPKCFEVEKALQDIGIPVMHDDQHGTAVVVLAALMNALKVVDKKLNEIKVVISGVGAAGIAIARQLLCLGFDQNYCVPVREIILCDSNGIIHRGRTDLNTQKLELSKITNFANIKGILADALVEADVFIGVSKAGVLKRKDVSRMNPKSIIFAMANPMPEIDPKDALKVAAVFGTGRSDLPNQINNSLAFPGIFKGALMTRAKTISPAMKIAAIKALARCVRVPTKDKILPSTLDKQVVINIAAAVKKAALSGK